MSYMAGFILVFYGFAALYFGYNQLTAPIPMLTSFAAGVTLVIGFFMMLAGAAHFRAPHKAFLISVPILVYFHTQMYFNALFYYDEPAWPRQILLIAISGAILILSYSGYSRKRAALHAGHQKR